MSGPEKSRAPRQSLPDQKDREARLKAALQANIARRKALERARAEAGEAARSAPSEDGEGA